MYEIGKKIKAVLIESKMDIQEFADKLHVARSTVYYIFDRNDISIDQLLRISKILNHDFIADVYGYEKEEEAKSEPPKFQLGDKWYTKSELKKAIEEHDRLVLKDYRQRIDAFLSIKKREPYYKVEILTEYMGQIETGMSLSDEDKQRASNFLAKPNSEDNENDTLFSIIDWNKYYEDCGFGELRDVTHVDFIPRYSYLFTAVVIESPEATPSIHPFYIEMTDKQYSQLLLLLMQQPLTVQKLERLDPELYRHITHNVSWQDRGWVEPQAPYVIFMTEAEKDANEILGDNDDIEGIPVSGIIRALLS